MCVNNKTSEFKQHPGNPISNISSNKVNLSKCWMDFKGDWREDGEWAKKEPINCWCRPRWRRGSGNFNLSRRRGLGGGSARPPPTSTMAVLTVRHLCSNSPVQMSCRQLQRVGTAGFRTKALWKLKAHFPLQLRLRSDVSLHLIANKCKTSRATLTWIAFNTK